MPSETSDDLMAHPPATTCGLFPGEAPKPTTRTIARLVKTAGVAGLPSALVRGDRATYQEIRCRSALNRVRGMPFAWTLNPYRGCTHGCHYCFARHYQSQLELDSGDQFASVILVKTNLVGVLSAELARASWARELVAIGTATDPYQPIEGHYQLTRRALEAFAAARSPIGIVTKGPLIVRDVDVLQDVSRHVDCTVHVSVPCVDEDVWRTLEPGTAHPIKRLRAVRALRDAGIECGVLMAPILPGISASPAALSRTIKAIADHGALFMGTSLLHLDGGTRDHFMAVLADEYPWLVEGYNRLYAGKYAPRTFVARVDEHVRSLQATHGVAPRRRRARQPPPAPDPEPEQVTLF